VGENFPVTLLSHCPHPLIFVNKLVSVVLVYSYFEPEGYNQSPQKSGLTHLSKKTQVKTVPLYFSFSLRFQSSAL
jgi:hypothetical protein